MSLFRRSAGRDKHRARDDARMRERMMDAAVVELVADLDATVEAIATRAKVPAAEVTRLFGSRADVVQATLVRGAQRIGHSVFVDDGTPTEQLALLVGRLWDDQRDVLPLTRAATRGPYRRAIEKELAPLRAMLRDIVATGVEGGDMRTDVPPRAVAWLVEQSLFDVLELMGSQALTALDGRTVAMTHALCAAGVGAEAALETAQHVTPRLDS